MKTLFDSRLSDRDFGSHLLHVGDLLEWVKAKRLHLRTTPPIDGYEFVQVEALLCAMERHANDLTPEQALEIVLNDPVLKNDPVLQKYPDDIDPTTCRWLLGAEAHRKWRVMFTAAIQTGELVLLDFGSKLPIETAPAVPAVNESASDDMEPKSDLPWWQTKHDIFDMAQNIGARLKSQHKRTSNTEISKEIEISINNIERSRATGRVSPDHDTIRGLLTGWRWKSN